MDTHKYKQIEQIAAKDLSYIESISHQKICHVKVLGASVFHVDLNMLRIG